MSTFRKYFRIYMDGRAVEPAPGTIPLIGIRPRKRSAAEAVFDGGAEKYLYVSYVEGKNQWKTGLERYFLRGPVAYTPNVLRIRILDWDMVMPLIFALHDFRSAAEAFAAVLDRAPQLDNPKYLYFAEQQRERKRYFLSDRARLCGPMQYSFGLHTFVQFKVKTKNGKIRMFHAYANGVSLKLFRRNMVVRIDGNKFVVSGRNLILEWGVYDLADSGKKFNAYGMNERENCLRSCCGVENSFMYILYRVLRMIEKKTPKRVSPLPTPISHAIFEQYRPLVIENSRLA